MKIKFPINFLILTAHRHAYKNTEIREESKLMAKKIMSNTSFSSRYTRLYWEFTIFYLQQLCNTNCVELFFFPDNNSLVSYYLPHCKHCCHYLLHFHKWVITFRQRVWGLLGFFLWIFSTPIKLLFFSSLDLELWFGLWSLPEKIPISLSYQSSSVGKSANW